MNDSLYLSLAFVEDNRPSEVVDVQLPGLLGLTAPAGSMRILRSRDGDSSRSRHERLWILSALSAPAKRPPAPA
jgi:hypothetical protein